MSEAQYKDQLLYDVLAKELENKVEPPEAESIGRRTFFNRKLNDFSYRRNTLNTCVLKNTFKVLFLSQTVYE